MMELLSQFNTSSLTSVDLSSRHWPLTSPDSRAWRVAVTHSWSYGRMRELLISLLRLLTLISCQTEQHHHLHHQQPEQRPGRNLGLFNIVSFPNSECRLELWNIFSIKLWNIFRAASGYNGTCYSPSQCSSLGGRASGTCAASFGVCCVFFIGQSSPLAL